MSEQWRILVVEDDEQLNQSTANSLRKDGYFVRGVRSGAEAIRVLWSEEYNVVIGDLKMPGADGMEMLQWLRAYRPRTLMVMVAANSSQATRTQALEGGVASYLQKPLDLHLLKEELRRLLQQTGFSASLDSFDLLDVIQIITMSRKSIALVVNTGPEERGFLCFQGGDVVWAEYGTLRGEEAFFALAAYKNGTVTQQTWQEQITPNVTQPLSRLIFQALQYRSKYAPLAQPSGEYEAVPRLAHIPADDDSPFMVLAETRGDTPAAHKDMSEYQPVQNSSGESMESKEWWQPTGKVIGLPLNTPSESLQTAQAGLNEKPADLEAPLVNGGNSGNIVPSTVHKTPASQRTDLPSWLTDLPSQYDMSMLRPSSLSQTAKMPAISTTRPSSAEWQPPPGRTTENLPPRQATSPQKSLSRDGETPIPRQHANGTSEWQPPMQDRLSSASSGPLQSLSPARKPGDRSSFDEQGNSGALLPGNATSQTAKLHAQRAAIKRNYPALVAALQTVGYSITGFIAAAVVNLDGQPIAQVAIDDLDISPMCLHFSRVLQGALQSLAESNWGKYEDTIITSADRHILLRIVGSDKEAFQVLITTRESEPAESLEVMANVEGAIGAALR
ncbi:MAG TPA: response regulator [Ktedonobacteraceae bacterium]|nr:response regulator [Ktedonobacteraceae bacterium]